MSDISDKGRNYETHIAKLIRRKADKGAQRNKGSHANWHRRSDLYTNLPIHVEAKHHENVRIKEWVEQAEAAKSFTQTAVVAFRIDEEDYGCLKFEDLLNLFVQIADLQQETEDLRQPAVTVHASKPLTKEYGEKLGKFIEQVKTQQIERGNRTCQNGHLVDGYNYCMDKKCRYSRGYRAPKSKIKGK